MSTYKVKYNQKNQRKPYS